MKKTVFAGRIALPLLICSMSFVFEACQKSGETTSPEEEIATDGKAKPPSTQPLYFTNCGNPVINGTFVTGTPSNVTVTLSYANGSGASYTSFTSTAVNGITLAAPAGVLTIGAGSITFTARGTPVAAGSFSIPVSIAGSAACNVPITVVNAGVTESTGDPGVVAGSTGTVNFIYQNQPVVYKTVRAKDGKVWIQQNLGSPRVAFNSIDESAYGHIFQWGRWDDGHQLPTSPVIAANVSLQNPLQIGPGNPAFIKNETPASGWWSGGSATNTWSGNVATAVNGKDPCAALGTGWRMPTAAEWQNIINLENISDTYTAFRSNLKLPAGSYRLPLTGVVGQSGDVGRFWTSTADAVNTAVAVFIDNAYGLFISPTERGLGLPCRCLKE